LYIIKLFNKIKFINYLPVLRFQTDDNIPLRIMLLLMDEIFDLKVRNQWLRRRIITLLRQIIRTMFGDIVNRRIVEYVSLLTSPAKVAGYLRLFKYITDHLIY